MNNILKEIGKGVGIFLTILFLVNLTILSFEHYILNSIDLVEYIGGIILFVIPTETTILEKLISYPATAITVLVLYVKYVKR